MNPSKCFASDNYSGVHPEILAAIQKANEGYAASYGSDDHTVSAVKKFQQYFGEDIDVYFVFNGTSANVLSISAITHSYHSVICADTSHMNVDECGAPGKFSGCQFIYVPTIDGKLTVDLIEPHIIRIGDEHHSQPKVISITQATELGTIYSIDEIKRIADFAHKNNMLLHMDGSRISNAAVSLGCGFRDFTVDAGVDVLSFGGTKNGMMVGEAVVFFDRALSKDFKYYRKQGMQLASKMRFISAQFDAMFTDKLWYKNAKNANDMTKLLESEVNKIPQIKLTQKVQANGVFAILPKEIILKLQEKYFFYVWNENTNEVRWMCSFQTRKEDIMGFVEWIKACL